MAIDGSINDNSGLIKKSDIETCNNPFYISNVIVAGTFKVKHLLIDQPMIIWGFVIYDSSFNQNDFRVQGNEISYKNNSQRFEYCNNNLIYPKMIIDNQQQHFSRFFRDDMGIQFRCGDSSSTVKKLGGTFKVKDYWGKFESDYSEIEKFKYYMFTDLFSDVPECATNESIWAICKFREGGVFQHAIFNFHELIPI